MKRALLLIFICIIALVIFKETRIQRPSEPLKDGCLFCHKEMTNPDPSHPVLAFGCAVCHLGNRYSVDRERAHFGMVLNPGDLRVADRTCGQSACHPDLVERVKTSLMATNKGILRVLQEEWLQRIGENPSSPVVPGLRVTDLYNEASLQNLAIDHFRKLCAGCHLWKPKGSDRSEVALRGGGCSDCHIVDEEKPIDPRAKMARHPILTTRIPSANCIKCHNRSARIGLSYFGRFESAGYGTPYEGSGLSQRRLSGNRFFMDLQADVHFKKAGMDCIDCHTTTGLMGDGREYDRMGDQVDITCEACHSPTFSQMGADDDLAHRLARLNRQAPDPLHAPVALTRKGTPIYNLQAREGKVVFYRKADGAQMEMKIPLEEKPHHRLRGHERLSCQACHAAWIPQCYGCHLTLRLSEPQTDWLTQQPSPGRWQEARTYLRFSRPALGIRSDLKIGPISPCQMFVSVYDRSGAYQMDRSFQVMNLSAFDPHTTTPGSRTCLECHEDPKVLGLGEGILQWKDGAPTFRPTYDPAAANLEISHPLDAYVRPDGRPLQAPGGNGVRPFNREELDRILGPAPCLGCHAGYDDPIYTDFQGSMRRFREEPGLPCLK